MRVDEQGKTCPETLGEYRDMCAVLGGERSEAVEFLDTKIIESEAGREEKVIIADSSMRALLFPMILLAGTGGLEPPSSASKADCLTRRTSQ